MAAAAPAQANFRCAERDLVVTRLAEKYGTSFSGGGMVNAQQIYEVWASDAQGTWTILVTMPNGQSCIMAAGTDWRGALPTPEPEPAGIPG